MLDFYLLGKSQYNIFNKMFLKYKLNDLNNGNKTNKKKIKNK